MGSGGPDWQEVGGPLPSPVEAALAFIFAFAMS